MSETNISDEELKELVEKSMGHGVLTSLKCMQLVIGLIEKFSPPDQVLNILKNGTKAQILELEESQDEEFLKKYDEAFNSSVVQTLMGSFKEETNDKV